MPDLDRASLSRVDKITFRTPDYQLSAAQDYRKGAPGSMQHIWQATLGPGTMVFALHPGPSGKSAGRWFLVGLIACGIPFSISRSGTRTAVISPSRSSRARWTASLASVLTRSPERVGMSEGAMTSQRTPICRRRRAIQKPHPLAS